MANEQTVGHRRDNFNVTPTDRRAAKISDEVQREDSSVWTSLIERRRSAFSATKRVGDSTEHDQAGVNRNQIYSHLDNEFCDGRELAAAAAFHPRIRLSFWNNCGIAFDPSPLTCTPSIEAAVWKWQPAARKLAPRRPTARLRALMRCLRKGLQRKKTRRTQRRRRRSQTRACSDTIEESSFG